MTLIELIWIVVWIGLIVAGWKVGAHSGGAWYYRALGAVIGGLIPIGVSYWASWSVARRNQKRPPYPTCETGNCSWQDYRAVGSGGSDIEFVCKCGKRYVQSRERFFKLLDDTQRQPYKRLNADHQWEDDEA